MRAFRFSALLFGMLAISAQADARGSFGGGFLGSFRGFSDGFVRVAPSVHVSGFHRQSIVRRRIFAGRQLHAVGLQGRQPFGQALFLVGGEYWWPDWWPGGSQIEEYSPAPEPPSQPQVIVIHADNIAPSVAEAAPDDGYVPGCHAIPNGYHCDIGGSAR